MIRHILIKVCPLCSEYQMFRLTLPVTITEHTKKCTETISMGPPNYCRLLDVNWLPPP
jgi:hypothetical protein